MTQNILTQTTLLSLKKFFDRNYYFIGQRRADARPGSPLLSKVFEELKTS